MRIPSKIIETPEILEYLKKRKILRQYQKAVSYLLAGYITQSTLKIRNPKKDNIRYFRINKKYRAIGFWQDEIFIVVGISNHQN